MSEKFISENGSKEDKVWGEGYPTIENYSAAFACKNQDCSQYGKNILIEKSDWHKQVVGVQRLPLGMQKENKSYAVICECPGCFDKFWFHGTRLFIDTVEDFLKDDRNK